MLLIPIPEHGRLRDMIFLFIRLALIHARVLLRNPVCLLLSLATALLTLLLPLAFAHTFGNTAARLAQDGGLAFQFVAGIVFAAYAACAITGSARASGTEALTLAKPVSPTLLFLARYAGIAGGLALFCVTTATATLLAMRIAEAFSPATGYCIDFTTATIAVASAILACLLGALLNRFRNASFHASVFVLLPLLLIVTAGSSGFYNRLGAWQSPPAYTLDVAILTAALRIGLALLMFAALTQVLALLLKPVSVGAAGLLILALGLTLPGISPAGSSPLRWLSMAIVPDWQAFWTTSASGLVPPPMPGALWLYAFCYITAILILGVHLFNRSEHA